MSVNKKSTKKQTTNLASANNTGALVNNPNKKSSLAFETQKQTSVNKSSSKSGAATADSLYKQYQKTEAQKPKDFSYNDKAFTKAYNDLMNRKDFSFDLNGSALYNQYKDKFTQQGQMAMQDTMGQAAAMTGGYGNSYAATVGQQVYQQNLSQLADVVPQLYSQALQQYQLEGDKLMNQYNVGASERDNAYNQYRDSVADWQNDRNFNYDKYINERDYEYQQGRDKVADSQWQQSFDYQKDRDKVADDQWAQEFGENQRQFGLNYNLEKDKFNESTRQWQENMDYQKGRDKVADDQWAKEFGENQRQFGLNYDLEKDKFNESTRQWQQNMDYQKGRDSVSDSQWQQSFNYQQQNDSANRTLDRDKLNETIRSNKANEKLARDKQKTTSAKKTKSYDKLSGTSKKLLQSYMNVGQDVAVDDTFKAYNAGKISEGDLMFILDSFGVDY